MKPAAILIDDGTIIPAKSIGSDEVSVGEIVFNTSMTGYQEIITDPSYDRPVSYTHLTLPTSTEV